MTDRRTARTSAGRGPLLAALLLAAAFGAPARAQEAAGKDTVQLADGSAVDGQIQSEDYAGLSIKGKGGKVELIPWADVRGVQYRDAADFAAADEAVEAGRLDEAG